NLQGLESIAKAIMGNGKGILAADETVGTLTKRFEKLKIPSTPESRRDYREMLIARAVSYHLNRRPLARQQPIILASARRGGTTFLDRGLVLRRSQFYGLKMNPEDPIHAGDEKHLDERCAAKTADLRVTKRLPEWPAPNREREQRQHGRT